MILSVAGQLAGTGGKTVATLNWDPLLGKE